jgi:hypothetical protein
VSNARSTTRRKIQSGDNLIVYRAKYEQLVVGRETFAYEFLFFRFREFELAGAEAQE